MKVGEKNRINELYIAYVYYVNNILIFIMYMILEESATKSPDTGKDKVDLIEFSRRVGGCVLLSQQTVQQRTQRLIEQHRNTIINDTYYDKEPSE